MEDLIHFTSEDLAGVQMPHNDALVITLHVGTFEMERILVAQGISTGILYLKAFKQLGLEEKDLVEAGTSLEGFSADKVLGKVTLNVQAGSIILPTDFLVVDVPSSYNAIIGRTWIHGMRAIPSSLHQKIKYPGVNGIEIIRGNQQVARQCDQLVFI